ncbi:hypothetical protein BJV78DRAFT_1278950 [Lactifluus subvellereus]|nr:hypothetical protein BJV78DRAFT_1278950 [Lactifluus subvellereus]
MAFFSSGGQEVYEYRLKRSSSTTSVRSRSRRPSGLQRLASQSRVHTHTPPLPRAETPEDVSSTRHNPSTASPSHIAALDVREQMIQDLKVSSTLLQAFPTLRSSQRRDDAGLELPQHHPGTSPSSAFSLRPKTNFDTGSVSDTGVVSRTPRPSRYLDVSLPRSLHLSPLDARHPSPSSPNLSPAGYLSEGGSPERSPSLLHPSRLDVKRLLSKPAAPSVASTLSITSDSESHTIPRAQLNPSEAWPSKTRIQNHVKFSTSSPTILRPESPERSPALSPPPSLQQRPRNLLRKRSAAGYMRATTTSAPSRRMSIPSSLQSIIRSPAAPPSRSSMLQSVLGSRAAVPTSPPANGSGRLTPAGQIAQAYKEQDMRREAFAAAARAESQLPTVPPSAPWLDTPERMFEQHATPTTEEVGSAQDALCHAGDHNPGLRSSGSQPVKSLTRKVSARLRRGLATISGAGAGDADGEGEQRNTVRGDLTGGNPSNQHERQRSSSAQKAKRKPESLRLSTDHTWPPPTSGLEDSPDERSVHAMPIETALDSASFVAQSKGKERAQEKDEASAGGRLWRLVKRISAGGLRERFHTASTPVPPVPAIPKDLLLPPPATLEGQILIGGHFMGSDTSISRASPSGDGHPTIAIAIGTPPPGTMRGHDASPHPPGPSTPSSPQSSEPTSTQFFRSHTPRSSFSSIVGTSPPAPPVPVPALARSPSPRTLSRSKSSSSARCPSNDERQGSRSPQTRTRQRSSPDNPTFSVADVVNNFIMRRPSLARHQKRHIPTRSLPKIVAPSPEDVGAFRQRPARSGSRDAAQQRDRVDPMLAPGSSGQSRDSHSSGGSTVCEPSVSSPTISAGTSVGTVAPLTFREAGGSRRQAWTSQEKEDRWDDLLERSARAGGTLHLGAGGARLASDNIRFSTSTLESEVLSR